MEKAFKTGGATRFGWIFTQTQSEELELNPYNWSNCWMRINKDQLWKFDQQLVYNIFKYEKSYIYIYQLTGSTNWVYENFATSKLFLMCQYCSYLSSQMVETKRSTSPTLVIFIGIFILTLSAMLRGWVAQPRLARILQGTESLGICRKFSAIAISRAVCGMLNCKQTTISNASLSKDYKSRNPLLLTEIDITEKW